MLTTLKLSKTCICGDDVWFVFFCYTTKARVVESSESFASKEEAIARLIDYATGKKEPI